MKIKIKKSDAVEISQDSVNRLVKNVLDYIEAEIKEGVLEYIQGMACTGDTLVYGLAELYDGIYTVEVYVTKIDGYGYIQVEDK